MLISNLLYFLVTFLFNEYNGTIENIISYLSIPLYFLLNIVLASMINKYKNYKLELGVLFAVLVLLRLLNILFDDGATMLNMLNSSFYYTILSAVLGVGEYFLYWWTVIVFPLFQIIVIFLFMLIISKFKNLNSASIQA